MDTVMSTTSANKSFVFGDAGHCIVFGFGLGLMPRMPGTAGTLLAYPLYAAMAQTPLFAQWLIAGVLLIGGGILCERAERALNRRDDSGMVIDEIVAFYMVLICIPSGVVWQLAAFILFRLLDALKPPPIRWIDAHIHGGAGVMLDDVAAAALTAAALLLLERVIG